MDALIEFWEQGLPFHRFLGLKVVALEPGRAVLEVPFREELLGDPWRRVFHGGVTAFLVDAAGGAACFSLVGGGEVRFSTVDMRVDYLRPAPAAALLCEAKVVRMGNRVAVTHMEVFSGALPAPGTPEREQPVATGQAVYNVVRASSGP